MSEQWIDLELNRSYHEVSNLFPLMVGAEYEELRADIQANGQLEPIWLHPDGSIVDGRNRHRACLDLLTEPRFRTWDNGGSLVSFVVSFNLKRRHLTSSQRAVIALDVLPMLEAEARERMLAGVTPDPPQIVAEGNGEAREQAAQLFQTNRQYVSEAKKLKEAAPDLVEEVRAGEKTIPQAKRELTRRTKKETPPLPSDKYRILYADPPWAYGNAGVIGENDNYGHVHRHYPSMSIGELCELGPQLKGIVESDAVLFLWVTSPLLEECFQVIRAWGFKYKTSFVWDKVGHNFGHYNSVRHELLLVCTRGSCTPDNLQLFDSVQTISKTDTHSQKPERFREIIDTLYLHGKRLELFARTEVDGWDSWGNENT